MKRFALTLAAIGLLSGLSDTAAVEIVRREVRTYADLNTPPEATTAAAGGLGVAAADEVKSRVRVEYSGGRPCGPMPGLDDGPSGSEGGMWLPVAVGAGGVAVLGFVVVLLKRRQKV